MQVAAYNEVNENAGELIYSDKRTVRTLEDTPETAPVFKNATAVTSTECYLVWERPDSRSVRGRALGYYLRAYKNGGNVEDDKRTVDPLQQSLQNYLLDALEKFTTYRYV